MMKNTINFLMAILLMASSHAICLADISIERPQENHMVASISLGEVTLKPKEAIQRGQKEERIAVNLHKGVVDHTLEGHPALPFTEYKVLIPYGFAVKDVDIRYENIVTRKLSQKIDFIPSFISTRDYADPGKRSLWESTLKEDVEIFGKDDFYTQEMFSYKQYTNRGYQVLSLKVSPFRYNPVLGRLQYSGHMICDIALIKSNDAAATADKYVRHKEKDIAFIKNAVANQEIIDSYQRTLK